MPPQHPSPPPPGRDRGDSLGWTDASARSNRQFLWSIPYDELTGIGFAVTLTVRETPPTAEAWKRLREAFFQRLRRMGLIRLHWVTEWQARGVPHLHLSMFFPSPEGTDWADVLRAGDRTVWATLEGHRVPLRGHPYSDGTVMGGDLLLSDGQAWRTASGRYRDSHLRLIDRKALAVVDAWVAVCGTEPDPRRPGELRNRAEPWSQEAVPIDEPGGWFHYVAKHAARGANHYQRARMARDADPEHRRGDPRKRAIPLPEGWTKTGRMWGYLGDWPRREGLRLVVDDRAFWAYRRVVRAHRKAMASRRGNGRAVVAARTMLKWPRRARRTALRQSRVEARRTSSVMPTSVDLEQHHQLRVVEWLKSRGADVVETTDPKLIDGDRPGERIDTDTGEVIASPAPEERVGRSARTVARDRPTCEDVQPDRSR